MPRLESFQAEFNSFCTCGLADVEPPNLLLNVYAAPMANTRFSSLLSARYFAGIISNFPEPSS